MNAPRCSKRAGGAVVAVIFAAAGLLITGCGSSDHGQTAGQDTAGYRVLTGDIPPAPSNGKASRSTGLLMASDFAHHWTPTSTATALFPNSSNVQLVATGRAGVRFRLFWEETCGVAQGRSLAGRTGGQTQLTLDTPARVLVKLPAASGSHDKCYLATTVLMPTKTVHGDRAEAPHVRIIHH